MCVPVRCPQMERRVLPYALVAVMLAAVPLGRQVMLGRRQPHVEIGDVNCLNSLDGTTGAGTCAHLIELQASACSTIFCADCGLAGKCDQSCGYCGQRPGSLRAGRKIETSSADPPARAG